jgi:hypothetical protein
MIKKLALACAALALAAAPLAAGAGGSWTGYITDSHCGAKGAVKEHTADCVEKCVKGGAKAQLVAADKTYDLDGTAKVKDLVGSKVTLKGTLDEKTNTIKVESAAKAEN